MAKPFTAEERSERTDDRLRARLQQAEERIANLQEDVARAESELARADEERQRAEAERDKWKGWAKKLEAAAYECGKTNFDAMQILRGERGAALQTIEGMKQEGCAAVGLVQNIFNGLTSKGIPGDPVLKEMADASAKLLLEATRCECKAERDALYRESTAHVEERDAVARRAQILGCQNAAMREALENAPEKHSDGPDEAIYRYWYDGYRKLALSPDAGKCYVLTEADREGIRKGVEAMKEGRVTAWEDVKKELGLGDPDAGKEAG